MRAAVCILATLLIGGCAKYEYNLVKPPELQRHIGRDADAVVPIDPLEYRLRTVDNRLVMQVFNPTSDPIELVGPRCTVVDPNGQSHPLRSQTIAPGSFIKLIFPPPRPEVYAPYYGGPYWGVGVGYHVHHTGWGHRCAGPSYVYSPYAYYPYPYYPGPYYLAVYDESEPYYWDWRGVGECRVLLTYRRGDKEIRHEFVFARQKM
jgi:hypothetical protein